MSAIIGITTSQINDRSGLPNTQLAEAYGRAITQAGGVPVLVPSYVGTEGRGSLFQRLDGILFSGGGDIDPQRFGAPARPGLEEVAEDRDVLELDLLRMSTSNGKPFLGICRGCQLVNVGLGGTLHTHLPDDIESPINHQQAGSERLLLVHSVEIEDGTQLREILGVTSLMVNSHHHQGLKDIAPPVRVAGRASDGLVEAIEVPDHSFGLAVQWHPEWLTDQPPTRRLFRSFVEAAARFSNSGR
jgi:putative glutamine amidotransferase